MKAKRLNKAVKPAALAAVLVVLALLPAAHAANYNGPLFQTLVCPLAEYTSGTRATCSVKLTNKTGAAFVGSVVVNVWQRSSLVGTETLAIPSLAAGASTNISALVDVSAVIEPRGYLITAHVRNGSGVEVDSGSGYIESAPSPLAFPRPGYVGNALANTNAAAQTADWLAWGVNMPVYFDLFYKAHQPAPPVNAATWTNLENQVITRSVVNSMISTARAAGMAFGVLGNWYASNDDWSTDGSGLLAKWGLYASPCGIKGTCSIWNGATTTAQQHAVGDTPPDWRGFGWKTNNLPAFDPSNGSYVAHVIRQMRALYAQFPFDIWWIDTIGDQGAAVYRSDGTQINSGAGLGPSLVGFVNAAITGTGRPAFINNVDRWADTDIASRASEPFIYSEIWSSVLGGPNGTPYYTDINGGMARYRQKTTKPVVFPAYVNDAKRHTPGCVTVGTLTTPCVVSEPTARYLTSQILASGAYHAFLVDIDTMASGPYFVEQQLGMTPSLMAAELDLQHWGIGNENWLREGVSDSLQPCSISGGPVGDLAGGAGKVYTLPKQRLGMNICHLLNHSTLTDIHWKDENATYPTPTVYTNFSAKVYYTGTLARVWVTSPEIAHGEPVVITPMNYVTALDGLGSYVTFTVPSLAYVTALVVENTALTGTDHDFDANQTPVRSR